MPSYAAAPTERPVTVSGDQPPRQLAKRKSAASGGRPPNPDCCGRPTKRISAGSSTTMCMVCQTMYGPNAQEPPKPQPAAAVLGPYCPKCATKTRRRGEQWRCEWCDITIGIDPGENPVAAEPAPGLNGDHETLREESKKMPPSRPANNSRGGAGGVTWQLVKDAPLPPCKESNKPKRNELTEAILALGAPPAHIQVQGLDDKARRSITAALRRRAGAGEFISYMTVDGSAAVFHRAAKSEVSR